MCESNAYLAEGDAEFSIMASVDVLEQDGEEVWRLVDLFESGKLINYRI